MSAHDSLCHSISPARSIYLDSGKAVNSRDCFSKTWFRIENLATIVNVRCYSFPPTCPAHDIFQRRYALQFNVLALADRF
jgi:hypothetical protein